MSLTGVVAMEKVVTGHRIHVENRSSLLCRVPVAHLYNPGYSEGKDQEDCGLKPAQTNSSQILS
jgi:hypothetical protein